MYIYFTRNLVNENSDVVVPKKIESLAKAFAKEKKLSVEVAVMKLDWENERFSFSLKQVMPDPWLSVSERFPEGSVHLVKIVRLVHFGAFATLEEGVDGLLHISTLGKGRKINHPREVVEVGQELEVRIEKLSLDEKRISLAPVAVDQSADEETELTEDSEQKEYESYKKQKAPSKSQSLGTLGDMLAAKLKEAGKK